MVVMMSCSTAPFGEVMTPIRSGSSGNGRLAGGVEQAFGGEAFAQHLDPGEQRAVAGIFQPLDDELVFDCGRHRR